MVKVSDITSIHISVHACCTGYALALAVSLMLRLEAECCSGFCHHRLYQTHHCACLWYERELSSVISSLRLEAECSSSGF